MRPILTALCVVIAGFVSACSGTHEPPHDHTAPTKRARITPAELDVPGLLGLSIDELSQRVGPRRPVPASFIDPTLAPQMQRNEPLDSTALFQCRGLAMVAAYDYQTRRINDLLLLGSNEGELMRRARLQLGAPHYLVLPVFQAQRPTQLLGLRVLATTLN
jgi:hypothetical protein